MFSAIFLQQHRINIISYKENAAHAQQGIQWYDLVFGITKECISAGTGLYCFRSAITPYGVFLLAYHSDPYFPMQISKFVQSDNTLGYQSVCTDVYKCYRLSNTVLPTSAYINRHWKKNTTYLNIILYKSARSCSSGMSSVPTRSPKTCIYSQRVQYICDSHGPAIVRMMSSKH